MLCMIRKAGMKLQSESSEERMGGDFAFVGLYLKFLRYHFTEIGEGKEIIVCD